MIKQHCYQLYAIFCFLNLSFKNRNTSDSGESFCHPDRPVAEKDLRRMADRSGGIPGRSGECWVVPHTWEILRRAACAERSRSAPQNDRGMLSGSHMCGKSSPSTLLRVRMTFFCLKSEVLPKVRPASLFDFTLIENLGQ